ncbi:MAG: AAA family ATPase, partial [Pseudomonadota bacterium]
FKLNGKIYEAPLIAGSGSVIDFYEQMALALNVDHVSRRRPTLLKAIRSTIEDLILSQKQRIIIVIDEANLLKPEILFELHTLFQYQLDSQIHISMLLAGQASLLDHLMLRSCAPIASRVIAKTHLSPINKEQMEQYLKHHLQVAGCSSMLFAKDAITAIFQGSGGLLRKAGSLARGGLITAAADKQNEVTPEHVRIAASELM